MSDLTIFGTSKKSTVLLLAYIIMVLLFIDVGISIFIGFAYALSGNAIIGISRVVFDVAALVAVYLVTNAVKYKKYGRSKFFEIFYGIYLFISLILLIILIVDAAKPRDDFEYLFYENKKKNSILPVIVLAISFIIEVYFYFLSIGYIADARKENKLRELEENSNQVNKNRNTN